LKDTFILKTAWKGVFDDLNDKQAGVLIKAVFNYIATGDKPELTDTELKMAFRFMQLDIDVFAEKYKTQVRTNAENGKKGGNPNFEKGKSNPYYKKDNPKITQITDHNPNETDKDTDTDNDNDEGERCAREAPPLTDVRHHFDIFVAKWNELANDKTAKVKAAPVHWLEPPDSVIRNYLARCQEHGVEVVLGAIDKLRHAKFWHGQNIIIQSLLDEYKFQKFIGGEYDNLFVKPDGSTKPDKSTGCVPIHEADQKKFDAWDTTKKF
jgi:hypothetical protein